MASQILLEIVTPDRPVLKEEVSEFTAPGFEGEFGVLPGHTTLLAQLGTGTLTYIKSGQPHRLQISGGFCEVRGDHATILADSVQE